MKYDFDCFNTIMKRYLTFYHEINIPINSFFLGINNKSDLPLLLVSSPSRMGNHLILSLLDGHSNLPEIPGEDGFLTFSFLKSNNDVSEFINNANNNNIDYFFYLNMNGYNNKWKLMRYYFDRQAKVIGYSGIRIKNIPSVVDYPGMIIDVNYNDYKDYYYDYFSKNNENFKLIFENYLSALNLLGNNKERKYKYKAMLVFSGMRRQLLWALDFYQNVKIISSIRPFDTYAVSHVKSRYGKKQYINSILIQEAWEHWYHKVVDLLYIKSKYPEKIMLINYEELTKDTENVMREVARFIDVKFEESFMIPTIFGMEVSPNSHESSKSEKGKIYSSSSKIDGNLIPKEYYEIMKAFECVKN